MTVFQHRLLPALTDLLHSFIRSYLQLFIVIQTLLHPPHSEAKSEAERLIDSFFSLCNLTSFEITSRTTPLGYSWHQSPTSLNVIDQAIKNEPSFALKI